MKRILFITALPAIFISCKTESKKIFTIHEYPINVTSLIDHEKELDYQNRIGYKVINNKRVLINLSKKQNLVFFNLDDGAYDQIETNFTTNHINAIKYNKESCDFIHKNTLYKFDYAAKRLDSILSVPLTENEAIIHNIYSETLNKFKDYYFVQYGVHDQYNWVDNKAILLFKKDTSLKLINTPAAFKEKYIHYNEIMVGNIADTLFYTYSTIPKIYKTTFGSQSETFTQIPHSSFINFDTTRMKDMRYIHDYTDQTTFNFKFFCAKNKVFLVHRYLENEKESYKLFVFDNNLNLLSESVIDHKVDQNFIFMEDDKLVFIPTTEKKVYEYEIN